MKPDPTGALPAAPGDLARLIATEERLEARLRVVRAEAERLLVEARDAATRLALAGQQETARRRGAVEAELAAERALRLEEIAAAATSEAAHWDSIGAERTAELVQRVVAGVIGVEGAAG